jgi:hypothetical protein
MERDASATADCPEADPRFSSAGCPLVDFSGMAFKGWPGKAVFPISVMIHLQMKNLPVFNDSHIPLVHARFLVRAISAPPL